MFEPLSIPPGVANNGTPLQVGNRWFNASQVRWVDGVMQPIGGWTAIATGISHPPRGMFTWETNEGQAWCAIGTSAQLLVNQGNSTLIDITPPGMAAGSDNSFQQLGYGGTAYGTGAYGEPNPAGAAYFPPTTWQLDAWGEDLVACASSDGKLYQWTLNTSPLGPPVVTNITTATTGGAIPAATYYYVMTALNSSGQTVASNEVSITVPGTTAVTPPTLNAPTSSSTGGALPAGTYFYKITVLTAAGESLPSNEISATVSGSTSEISFTWTAVPTATGYRVYRGTTSNGENIYVTATVPAGTTTFTDTNPAGSHTSGSPPVANTATITLTWGAVSGATSFNIYRGTSAGGENVFQNTTNTVTYTDTGFTGTAGTPPKDNTAVATATLLTNAPTNNAGLFVSEQQHLFAVGAGGNPKLVQWSDQENNNVWTPSTTNEAGELVLQTNGACLRGVSVAGLNLILTTTDAHAMQYLGQPLIWNRTKIGDKCGLISALAVAVAGNAAWWMSDKRFWTFNGGQVQEVPCEVQNYVFNRLNSDQAGKIVAGTQGKYGEVTWFYPSTASTENDSYVTYNYLQNHWQVGALARSSWADADALPAPMATDAAGNLYIHETGTLDNGNTRKSEVFAQTGALQIGAGSNFLEVSQLITDEKKLGDIGFTFNYQNTPNGPVETLGPVAPRSDGYVDARFTGRQVQMTVAPLTDNAWQLGVVRWDGQPGSER